MIDTAARQASPGVAVCLDPAATTANRNLRTALALEGCHALDIAPADLAQRLPELSTCLVLVYDASPGGPGVAPIIRESWLRFPDLPLLPSIPLSVKGAESAAERTSVLHYMPRSNVAAAYREVGAWLEGVQDEGAQGAQGAQDENDEWSLPRASSSTPYSAVPSYSCAPSAPSGVADG